MIKILLSVGAGSVLTLIVICLAFYSLDPKSKVVDSEYHVSSYSTKESVVIFTIDLLHKHKKLKFEPSFIVLSKSGDVKEIAENKGLFTQSNQLFLMRSDDKMRVYLYDVLENEGIYWDDTIGKIVYSMPPNFSVESFEGTKNIYKLVEPR
jgi:hypothetical protein